MLDVSAVAAAAVSVVALLAASAFFSSAEIAIFSLPPDWLESVGAAEDGRARTLADLREDPHRLLVTLLVGNNLVNVALTSVVAVVVSSVLPPGDAVVVSTALASTVVLVFGEILPKSLGLGHAREWAMASARPIRLLQVALYPIVAIFDAVTGWLGGLVGGTSAIEQPLIE